MSELYQIAIVGAGPAGISAAINASKHALSHILLEKAELANTIYEYQLGKLVMAEPSRLPLSTPIPFKETNRKISRYSRKRAISWPNR